MRKLGFATLLLGLIATCITSCSDDDDEEWRDNNLAFFDSLADKSDLSVIGDSINGYPQIYYKVMTEGTGATPIIGNQVTVYYAGWLWNDTISYDDDLRFDDKRDRYNAFDYNIKGYEFTVGGSVIDGWNLAIQSMKVGSRWRVFIPYYLAYGSSGSSSIPAYSTLIFDIYLKEISEEN
jgi:FKBP-type peptidyl-prolyl cis-trans isomerase FklB